MPRRSASVATTSSRSRSSSCSSPGTSAAWSAARTSVRWSSTRFRRKIRRRMEPNTKELFRDVEVKMKHAVDHLHHELKSLRTGRASTSILEGVMVDYYGTPTPINQVANLTVADATLLVAQPWDPSQLNAIEKGIRSADLGLNPSNDGKLIRIPVPPLTE